MLQIPRDTTKKIFLNSVGVFGNRFRNFFSGIAFLNLSRGRFYREGRPAFATRKAMEHVEVTVRKFRKNNA